MVTQDKISAKDFLEELRQLCRRHGITLSTSGYDGLQFHDLVEGGEPVYCAGVTDCRYGGERDVE